MISALKISIFHDDIDLGAGKIRVKQGGGHGGHNGLRDIDRHIGKEYWRVRIGVGGQMDAGMTINGFCQILPNRTDRLAGYATG